MSEQTAQSANLPEGFAPLAVSGQQNWATKGEGVEIRGILKGRFARSKGKQHFYQIQLTQGGVLATFDKEEVTLDKGDTVCVDETHALKVLAPLTDDGKNHEVFIRFVEKVQNQNDPTTSFWRMEVGGKEISADDMPF